MPKYFDFEVSLVGIEPRIWRRFLLADAATFLDLHGAVQDAMGWEEEHLYDFRDSGGKKAIARCDHAEQFDDRDVPTADKLKLAGYFTEVGKVCGYTYDFGDNWKHSVTLKGVVEDSTKFRRRLLDGARACPLEDCGGTWGYEDCCRVRSMSDVDIENLGDEGEEMAWRKEWIGDWDPEVFDLAAVKTEFD